MFQIMKLHLQDGSSVVLLWRPIPVPGFQGAGSGDGPGRGFILAKIAQAHRTAKFICRLRGPKRAGDAKTGKNFAIRA